MNIIQRPQALSFAADLIQYKIDSDVSITFDIKFGGQHILKERYSPDGNYKIQTHGLGKLCAAALWGKFPSGVATVQDKVMGVFSFEVNGAADSTSKVIASHKKCRFSPDANYALTLSTVRTTHPGSNEWLSFYMGANQNVIVTAYNDEGVAFMKNAIQVSSEQVLTIDASPARIASMFADIRVVKYKIGNVTFRIDQTNYYETFQFRFLNNFDLPEAVTATGTMAVKASDKHTDAYMNGIQRRVEVTSEDEYTVSSGVIFSQSDYIIWRELISSRRVQVLADDRWVDIIITKSKFERSLRRNLLKQVEVSFKVADAEEGCIYD